MSRPQHRAGATLIASLVGTAIVVIVVVMLMGANGCDQDGRGPSSIDQELKTTEDQQSLHLKVTPPPKLTDSLERRNLIERLKRFNDPNKVSFIYLIEYGKVMAHYTVKGKVSSVNSLLTQPSQPVWRSFSTQGGGAGLTVPSPDLDGSYGSNGDAVFFYTTDGTYVEWRGDYMLCDKPLSLRTPPELVLEVDGKGNAVR